MKGRKKRQNKLQFARESTDISREILLYVTCKKSKDSKVEAKRFFAGMSAFVQVFTGLSSSSCSQFGYNNTTQITECVAKGDFKRSNWLLPVVLCPVVLFTPITVTHNSACERDECSFMSVMAVARLVFPMANTCRSISQSINWSINQSINQSIV